MNTLIIPCAGKSSRYPDMKPKWLLTHPDGKPMIQKAIECINQIKFNDIYITILEDHCKNYDAEIILNQIFKNYPIKICILKKQTNGPAETVYNTIKKNKINGCIVIKDSDNYVEFKINKNIENYICGIDIKNIDNLKNINRKSFIIVDDKNIIQKIIEKKIASDKICTGVYGFENSKLFINGYENIINNDIYKNKEIFISDIVSNVINKNHFNYIEIEKYEDWGDLDSWKIIQQKYKTIFCDIDGVLFKNTGEYGIKNWMNDNEAIEDNVKILNELYSNGAKIILTTSRHEKYRQHTIAQLKINKIKFHMLIMSLPHSQRLLINDFANTNQYPSCASISIPRNSILKDYKNIL